MSEFFRVVRGIELDRTIRILQGAGAPGSTADTNTALVGSIYTDNVTGSLYTKITPGSGPLHWAISSGGGGSTLYLYAENPVAPTPPAAGGDDSIALGSGATTDVAAPRSLAIGDQSLARHPGAEVFANGRFASTGDCQAGRYLLRTQTVNATPAEAFLDGTGGSQRLVLPDDSTWSFKIRVTAHQTNASTGHASYTVEGVIHRAAGTASVSFQGSPVKTVLAESDVPWDINITADTTFGSLKIEVVGQAAKTIRWAALVETLEVTN